MSQAGRQAVRESGRQAVSLCHLCSNDVPRLMQQPGLLLLPLQWRQGAVRVRSIVTLKVIKKMVVFVPISCAKNIRLRRGLCRAREGEGMGSAKLTGAIAPCTP